MRVLARLARIFLFFSCSFLDLKIEAKVIVSLPMASEVVTMPPNCLSEAGPCTVLTPNHKKFELMMGKSKVTMDEHTEVLRENASSLTLVKGVIWIHADGLTTVKSEYGSAETQAGEIWVQHKPDKVVFSNIFGELKLKPKGTSEELILYPGFENWLGPVTTNGMGTSGIPMLLSIEDHVHRWARLYPGKKSDFKKAVHDYFNEWQSHIDEASEKQEALVKRYIDDENEKQKRDEIRRKSIREENARVRDMMRKRLMME